MPLLFSLAIHDSLVEANRVLWGAWQILLQKAGPRCHHMLRTLPPTQSRQHAEEHDAGMQRTMEVLLGGLPGDDQAKDAGVKLATLPMRLGG